MSLETECGTCVKCDRLEKQIAKTEEYLDDLAQRHDELVDERDELRGELVSIREVMGMDEDTYRALMGWLERRVGDLRWSNPSGAVSEHEGDLSMVLGVLLGDNPTEALPV